QQLLTSRAERRVRCGRRSIRGEGDVDGGGGGGEAAVVHREGEAVGALVAEVRRVGPGCARSGERPVRRLLRDHVAEGAAVGVGPGQGDRQRQVVLEGQ